MLGKHKDFIMADPNQFDDKIKKEFCSFKSLQLNFLLKLFFNNMTNQERKNFNILDCTLRDGGYYNNWNFPIKLISSYLNEISKTNIKFVELGFRFTQKNNFRGVTAYTKDNLFRILEIPKKLKIGVMVNASDLINKSQSPLTILKTLFPKKNEDIKFIRFACHLDEVFKLNECINWLNQRNMFVFINIMQISEINRNHVFKICNFLKNKRIKAIYLADSLGSLDKKSLIKIIKFFKYNWKGDLGIHAHDNLNLALKNSMIAIKNDFKWVDCTISGMGRGPGNLKTEDIIKNYDYKSLKYIKKLNKNYFNDLKKIYKWGSNKYYALAAKYKIHPTYIQEMLSDKRYSSKNYLNVINNLKKKNSKKYNLNNLFSFNTTYFSKGKGKWFPINNFYKKKIIIVGPGETVQNNRKKIENFIRNKIF